MVDHRTEMPEAAPAAAAFDPAAVDRLDWAIIGAGVLTLIFSFFDYYTVSASFGGYSVSDSASAWHGFFGWFATLCALAASAVLLAQLAGRLPANLPLPGRLVTLGGFALATLCTLIAFLVYPGDGDSGLGVHIGHGIGYWGSLVFVIVGLALSYRRFTAEGGVLPGRNKQ
jgi:hypothetical protein